MQVVRERKKRLLILRATTVVLDTVISLLSVLQSFTSLSFAAYVAMFMIVPKCIVCIWITAELFGVSKALDAEDGGENQPE